MAIITCLEKRSTEERNRELIRSDYNRDNQYNAEHPNARATGDAKGKGTGSQGHGDWMPDCEVDVNVFNYSNFNTDPDSGAGNDADNEARNEGFLRCKYSANNPYGDIDVTTNAVIGQYFVP